MSLFQPPPAPITDTRNETTKNTSNEMLAMAKDVYSHLLKLWNFVWANPKKTPIQTVAELGTNGVAAFSEYTAFGSALTSATSVAGIDFSQIDPQKSGAVTPPAVPDGWTYASTDGQTLTLSPPPATAPQNLTVSAVTTLPGPVQVSWSPVAGALGYTIQRSQDGGASFQAIVHGQPIVAVTTGGGMVVKSPAPNSMFDVDAVSSGTQYQVSVTTPAGDSAFSAPVTL